MTYTITPSPLSGTERLLVTADPRGIALARSLDARQVRAHGGYFLASKKAVIWTALYEAGAQAVQRSYCWRYKLPGAKCYEEMGIVIRRMRDAAGAAP